MASKKVTPKSLASSDFEVSAETLSAPSPGTPQESLLKLRQVQAIFPVSKTIWYSGIKAGIYPQSVLLSRRSVAWRKSDIDALIAQRSSS